MTENPEEVLADPVGMIVRLVSNVEKHLDADRVRGIVCTLVRSRAGRRNLAQAPHDNSSLLRTGKPPAPFRVAKLLMALHEADAQDTALPRCAKCPDADGDPVKELTRLITGLDPALDEDTVRIALTHATKWPAGQPLCPNCLIRDPVNLEVCVGCGRRRPVAVRLADGVRRPSCRPKEIQECGHCGRTALCEISRATGQPWCERCQQRWVTCDGCGTVAQARGGSFEEPLCAKCTNPDPSFWGRCPVCETTWQLSPRVCRRCVLDQKTRDLLGNGIGTIGPELVPFHEALTGAERSDGALAWISRPKVQDLLERVGRDERRVTHDSLDGLPSGKVLAHLRSVLVATGALTPRDERLVALEKWITETVQARTDLTARRTLHGYAVWHHPRRLRRRIGDQRTTQLQDINVRCHVTAADNFLTRLAAQGLALGTCTRADLERWMTDPVFTRQRETLGRRTTPTHRRRRQYHRRDSRDHLWDLAGRPPDAAGHLVRELVANRRGKAKIGTPDDAPRLFPGGRPGRPLSDSRIGLRLHEIGIRPQQDRSTALFTLAAELPAAILARLLGVHIQVAVQWQRASTGDRAAYAADVSRRNAPHQPIHDPGATP